MTRKHFESLTQALKYAQPHVDPKERSKSEAWGQWYICVKAVSSACAQHNSSFDRDAFYRACGLD